MRGCAVRQDCLARAVRAVPNGDKRS